MKFLRLLPLLPALAHGFPTGAGSCRAGNAAPAGPHTNGLLGGVEAGDYSLSLDGTPIGAVGSVAAGSDSVLTLEANNGAAFRGFLVRLSASAGDVSGALSADDADVQIMLSTGEANGQFPAPGTCAEVVAGATHTNRDDKTAVDVSLAVPDLGSNYELLVELTVVQVTNSWYFSPFEISVEAAAGGGEPPAAGSDAPTDAPPATGEGSDAPTDAPPAGATDAPTPTPDSAASGPAIAALGLLVPLLSVWWA